MSTEFIISQDLKGIIYLVENDGVKDIKEDIYPTYQEAVDALTDRVGGIKKSILSRYNTAKGVLEILDTPKNLNELPPVEMPTEDKSVK